MAHELDVRDRSYHLKKYASCFVGSEAVTWMVSAKVADDADHAVVLGNEMLRLGLLHHVKHEHAFENKYLFYRFHDLSSDADSELDNPCGTPRSTQSTVSESAHVSPGMPARDGAKPRGSLGRLRGTNTGKGWSLAGEVTRVQRRLCDVAADLEMQKSMCDVMFDSTAEQLRGNQQINVILEQKLREILTTQRRTNRVLQRALWAADTRAKRGPAAYEGGDGSWETLPRQPSLVLPLHAEAFAPGSDASASDDTETMVYATEPCLGTSDRQQAEPSTAQPVPGPEPPSIADFEDWPDAPALCRMKPGVEQRLTAGGDPTHIPYNTGRPIQFESELFKGCVLINVAGLSTAPADLFQGKRRKTSLTVQGRFKQPLGFDDVLTGQEFNRAPTNLPGKWLVETVLMKMAKRISPSMVIGPLSAPYVLVPIIAMAQSIHVGDAESAPDPAGTIPEDMTALDPSFTDKQGQPWAAAYRKRFFLDAKQRADRRFDTDKIWTFAIYQHFVDMGTYELDMIHRFDLSRHLDGQPLQFMAKDKTSGQYLFNFEAWHEKLLPAAEAHYMKQQAAAGTNSSAQPSPEPPAHS
ncbi:hypothetical protein WJX72_002783 [[Myrmecia] bisecta]|uniref:DEP domain-containing protein n=1 Tax=[Myrmecia] bisecta TaxID=41462 RepID=A0AAW1P2E5_9CHLO